MAEKSDPAGSSEDILDLTDLVEDGHDAPVSGAPAASDAGVDMSFEKELDDLFAEDAAPPRAAAPAPPSPSGQATDEDILDLTNMDLADLDRVAAAPAASSPDTDADEVVDLADLVEDGPEDPAPEPRAAPAAPPPAAKTLADEPLDLSDLLDEEPTAPTAAPTLARQAASLTEEADLDLSDLAEEPVAPVDAARQALDEAAFADIAPPEVEPASAPPISPSPAMSVTADKAIDLAALDALIAQAGGPAPEPEAEADRTDDADLRDRLALVESEAASLSKRFDLFTEDQARTLAELPETLSARLSDMLGQGLDDLRREAAAAPAGLGRDDLAEAVGALKTEILASMEALRGEIEARATTAGDTEALVERIRQALLPDLEGDAQATKARIDALEARVAADLDALRDEFAAKETEPDQAGLVEQARQAVKADLEPSVEALAERVGELETRLAADLAALRDEFADKGAAVDPAGLVEQARQAVKADLEPSAEALAERVGELETRLAEEMEALRADLSARPTPIPAEAVVEQVRQTLLEPIEARLSAAGKGVGELSERLGTELADIRAAIPDAAPAIDPARLDDLAARLDDLAARQTTLSCALDLRVTRIDLDAAATRLRMDLEAALTGMIPAAAAKIIREEIEALAATLADDTEGS